MPKLSRTARRRAAAIHGAKILLTSASLVATIGGWAAISAADSATEEAAQVVSVTEQATTTPVAPTATAVSPSEDADSDDITDAALAAPTATVAPTTTQAPIATARPMATPQVRVRTRSSR